MLLNILKIYLDCLVEVNIHSLYIRRWLQNDGSEITIFFFYQQFKTAGHGLSQNSKSLRIQIKTNLIIIIRYNFYGYKNLRS